MLIMPTLYLIIPHSVDPFGGVMCVNWLINTVRWLLQCWVMAGPFFFGLTDGWLSSKVPASVKIFPGSFPLLLMSSYQCLMCFPRSFCQICICLSLHKPMLNLHVSNS